MTDSDFMSKVQFSLDYLLKLVSHRGISDEICFLRWSFPFFIVTCYLVFSNSNWVIPFSTGSVPKNSKMPRTAWITLHWFLVLNLTQPLVTVLMRASRVRCYLAQCLRTNPLIMQSLSIFKKRISDISTRNTKSYVLPASGVWHSTYLSLYWEGFRGG